MSIYSIDTEYLRLLDKESYTEEDLHAIDLLSKNEREKATILASYVLNMKSELAGVTDAIKSMKLRSERLISKIENIEDLIMQKMKAINATSISDSPHFEIRIYNNPFKVDVYDKAAIPEHYWKTKSERLVSLDDIKHDILINGMEVPGASIVQSKHLRIK